MTPKPNQVENMLLDLMETKEKLKDAKEILKSYKIKSDKLTELTRAKKDIAEQAADEKKRIEEEYLADKDYEQAKADEQKYKNEITEKSSDIKEVMKDVNKDQLVSSYDYNIKGEPVKMHVERVVKMYLNGQEAK